jgi:hypothetical protein
VINCARIELVVALHSLASQFENETSAFTGDDLTAVQGHIRHARKVAAKHNQNGPGCAPPAPEPGEPGEVGLLVDRLNQVAGDFDFLCNKIVNGECRTLACLRRGGYDDELCSAKGIKPPDPLVATCPALEKAGAMRRAATLLQQQQLRITNLRSALADCGRAVGASISDGCSDDFLLEVATEVRLAIAKAAPAVVAVAWCRSDEFTNSMRRGGSFNGWQDPGAGINKCDMRLYAIPPSPAGEVKA